MLRRAPRGKCVRLSNSSTIAAASSIRSASRVEVGQTEMRFDRVWVERFGAGKGFARLVRSARRRARRGPYWRHSRLNWAPRRRRAHRRRRPPRGRAEETQAPPLNFDPAGTAGDAFRHRLRELFRLRMVRLVHKGLHQEGCDVLAVGGQGMGLLQDRKRFGAFALSVQAKRQIGKRRQEVVVPNHGFAKGRLGRRRCGSAGGRPYLARTRPGDDRAATRPAAVKASSAVASLPCS